LLNNLRELLFIIMLQVKSLKGRIEELKGSDYPAEGQKLIYSGKILADETQLKEYSIDEGKFIVVMVSKPKVATSAAQSTPTPVPTTPALESVITPSTTTPAATPTVTSDSGAGQPAATVAAPLG
jgi:UV excision repair protein RAD23